MFIRFTKIAKQIMFEQEKISKRSCYKMAQKSNITSKVKRFTLYRNYIYPLKDTISSLNVIQIEHNCISGK